MISQNTVLNPSDAFLNVGQFGQFATHVPVSEQSSQLLAHTAQSLKQPKLQRIELKVLRISVQQPGPPPEPVQRFSIKLQVNSKLLCVCMQHTLIKDQVCSKLLCVSKQQASILDQVVTKSRLNVLKISSQQNAPEPVQIDSIKLQVCSKLLCVCKQQAVINDQVVSKLL